MIWPWSIWLSTSKLRGCDLVRLRVQDVARGGRALSSTSVVQRKTTQPVKFELTEQTRQAVQEWVASLGRRSGDYLFPCRLKGALPSAGELRSGYALATFPGPDILTLIDATLSS